MMKLRKDWTMTIEFKEGRYFAAMWFVSGEDRDLHGALYKDDDGSWLFRYRFRYYDKKSKDPFDGEDRKSWYDARFPADKEESETMSAIAMMMDMTAKEFGGVDVHKLILRTDSPYKIMEAMSREEWCHVKELAPGEKLSGEERG
jgi:hypothetical protein